MKTLKSFVAIITLSLAISACNSNSSNSTKNTKKATTEVATTKKSDCGGCPHSKSCGAATTCDDNKEVVGKAKPQSMVLYFHYAHRCATCNAVEKVTKEVVDKFKGKIGFKSVNLDDNSTKKMAKKLKIDGNTLLVISNGKHHNLTQSAFLNARNNPEKYKKRLLEVLN